MNKTDFQKLSTIIIVLSVFIITTFTLLIAESIVIREFALILLGLFTTLVSILVAVMFVSTTRRNPRALSIALIGPPAAGKTVYLTMLYRELENGKVGSLIFSPYGRQTTETISYNLSLMASGVFPPPTPLSHVEIYEAVASYGSGFFSQRYRLQIADFAGEHLNLFRQIGQENNRSLDSELLDYAQSCDAILLMIDTAILLDEKKHEIALLENNLVTFLHLLVEKRGKDPFTSLRLPIGLIISKSDLLEKYNFIGGEDNFEMEISRKLARLFSVTESRFSHFRLFLVSSLGSTPYEPNIPPVHIQPKNILEPLFWILGKS